MVVAARKDSETKVSLSFFFVCGLDFRKEHFPMPKTLPQRIVFTIVMATIMVYGMIVYNVALNTGGVTNNNNASWSAGVLAGFCGMRGQME